MSLSIIAQKIDSINDTLGKTLSWLALLMVLVMFANVVGRYLFNSTLIWQQELVRFMHAILFLACAGYTLLKDKHVRVDLIYQQQSERYRYWVDLLGSMLFLIPFALAILVLSFTFVSNSWSIFESSPEYNGMPGVFILKSFIWVFALTLIMQACATILRSIHGLKHG